MTTLEKIRTKYPSYSTENFKLFSFWRNNLEMLDLLIQQLQEDCELKSDESEVGAIKRLGKLDLLYSVKNTVKNTEEFLKQMGE